LNATCPKASEPAKVKHKTICIRVMGRNLKINCHINSKAVCCDIGKFVNQDAAPPDERHSVQNFLSDREFSLR
jgi:hypothetical protein